MAGPRSLHFIRHSFASTSFHPCTYSEACNRPLSSPERVLNRAMITSLAVWKMDCNRKSAGGESSYCNNWILAAVLGVGQREQNKKQWGGTFERMWGLVTHGLRGEEPLVLLAQVTKEVGGMLLLKGGLLFFLFSGGEWDWEGNLREVIVYVGQILLI